MTLSTNVQNIIEEDNNKWRKRYNNPNIRLIISFQRHIMARGEIALFVYDADNYEIIRQIHRLPHSIKTENALAKNNKSFSADTRRLIKGFERAVLESENGIELKLYKLGL